MCVQLFFANTFTTIISVTIREIRQIRFFKSVVECLYDHSRWCISIYLHFIFIFLIYLHFKIYLLYTCNNIKPGNVYNVLEWLSYHLRIWRKCKILYPENVSCRMEWYLTEHSGRSGAPSMRRNTLAGIWPSWWLMDFLTRRLFF